MENQPSIETVLPCSGQYAFKRDLRLNAWLGVAALVYLVQLFILRSHLEWTPLARGLVALTPLIPTLLYIADWVRFIRELDELQRRVQVQAHVFAAWGTILIGMILTTLNEQGALNLQSRGLGFGTVALLVFPLWLMGYAIANCRFR